MMNRDEFEKLPEIAKRLHAGIYWNDYQGKYQTDSQNLLATVGYLNGSWYAYKELQKKIDEAMRLLNTIQHNADIANLIFKIQSEVLK